MSSDAIPRQKETAGSHNAGSGEGRADPWVESNPIKRLFLAYYKLTGENLHPELIDEGKNKTGQKAMGGNP